MKCDKCGRDVKRLQPVLKRHGNDIKWRICDKCFYGIYVDQEHLRKKEDGATKDSLAKKEIS